MPPKFEVIEDDSSPPNEVPAHTLDTLLEGLKALPKRTAQILSDCFALLTVATVFCLALMIIPYQPNTQQLIGLGGYALFVIAVNVITRRGGK
jgi:lipopolysaccharide export LptBFGC system permease protein LptF